jgi:hypothetical protein
LSFSFSVLFSNEPNKKKRRRKKKRAYSSIAKNRTILFSPLSLSSLFLLRTKQEIIIYIDVVEKEERLEKAIEKKKERDLSFTYITMPSL